MRVEIRGKQFDLVIVNMTKLPTDLSKKTKSSMGITFYILTALLIVFIAFDIAFGAIYSKVYVVGSSMLETLQGAANQQSVGGDYVYIIKDLEPERGDIVVISTEDKVIIKRVIALGGDTVELKKGVLYLNGELVEEPYLSKYHNTPDFKVNTLAPIKVPEGQMFCMGDNRNDSLDSRTKYGCMPVEWSLGVVADWSIECKDFVTGWNTFFEFTLPGCFK